MYGSLLHFISSSFVSLHWSCMCWCLYGWMGWKWFQFGFQRCCWQWWKKHKTETRDYLNSGDGIPFPLWNSIQKRESNVQFHLKLIVNFSFLLVLKEFTKSKRELANFLLRFKLCALGITWLYKYYAECLLSLLFICDAYRKRILLYCVIIT